jgi:hypothetical protein
VANACFVCEREPVEPFLIAGFGSVCGAGDCVERLRRGAQAILALDPTSRPVLEENLLSDNPYTALAASKAIAVQDAVAVAPMH